MENNKTILIIDDEEWYYEPILERLEYEGITYNFCRTGYAGLQKLEIKAYKVILLDMKVSLGEELKHIIGYGPAPGIYILEKIKERNKNMPVICYTVLTDDEVVAKIVDLGGKHLAKGSLKDTKALIDEIKKYL
ncbi:MAG: response regulator [Acidobacteria bacterium]|jgi:CheY-like chemotaxis protein|nr:response regulator [Acidobacteriota bacterium]